MFSEIAPDFKPNIWGGERVAFPPKDSSPTARRRLAAASLDGQCDFRERPNTAPRGTAAVALPPPNPAGLVARSRRDVDQTEPKEVLTIEFYGNPAAKFQNILERGDGAARESTHVSRASERRRRVCWRTCEGSPPRLSAYSRKKVGRRSVKGRANNTRPSPTLRLSFECI